MPTRNVFERAGKGCLVQLGELGAFGASVVVGMISVPELTSPTEAPKGCATLAFALSLAAVGFFLDNIRRRI